MYSKKGTWSDRKVKISEGHMCMGSDHSKFEALAFISAIATMLELCDEVEVYLRATEQSLCVATNAPDVVLIAYACTGTIATLSVYFSRIYI